MSKEAMTSEEAITMMSRCLSEIKLLREQVNYLTPKAEAYDALRQILSFFPQKGVTMRSEDLMYVLQKRIKEISPVENASA